MPSTRLKWSRGSSLRKISLNRISWMAAVVGRERLEERCVAARNSALPNFLTVFGYDENDPCPFVDNAPSRLQQLNRTQFWEGMENIYEEIIPIAKPEARGRKLLR